LASASFCFLIAIASSVSCVTTSSDSALEAASGSDLTGSLSVGSVGVCCVFGCDLIGLVGWILPLPTL